MHAGNGTAPASTDVRGLVTICAECKRVIGYAPGTADGPPGLVSHGICPECARKLYGRFFEQRGPAKG